MNHTTLALVAVIAAAALVIGTFVTTTLASSAFASSKTIVKQSNKQKLEQSGIVNVGEQNADNNICVLSRANCGRTQGTDLIGIIGGLFR